MSSVPFVGYRLYIKSPSFVFAVASDALKSKLFDIVAIPLESMPKSSLYFDESAIFLVHALSISIDIYQPTSISGIPMLMPLSITDTTPFAIVSELSFLNRFFRYSALARDT